MECQVLHSQVNSPLWAAYMLEQKESIKLTNNFQPNLPLFGKPFVAKRVHMIS